MDFTQIDVDRQFLLRCVQAEMLLKNPTVLNALKQLKGTPDYDQVKALAEEQVRKDELVAVDILSKMEKANLVPGAVRIFVDGCFDLPHSGHYNAIRQAKELGDFLVVGVNSDEDILATKGPSIMNQKERAEIIRQTKFADQIIEGSPYTFRKDYLDSIGCHFWAHGDDPCIDKDGVDICEYFRNIGMFKEFKRTEGVSTTSITAKLLKVAESLEEFECTGSIKSSPMRSVERMENPPKQTFLATTRRIINFANKNMPRESDTIVYIQGSFDLLHHGHMRRLELAKQLGDFLYVGLWDDEMTSYYRGDLFPVQSLQERVLMTLACKHVDDVVIGAPFFITHDLIASLKIKKVVVITDTAEDRTLVQYADLDQFQVPREMGIMHKIKVADPFYDVTVEKLSQRLQENKAQFAMKISKKAESEQNYYKFKQVKSAEWQVKR